LGLIPDVAAVVLDDVAAQGESEAQTLTAILGRPQAPDRGKEHGASGFRDSFAGVIHRQTGVSPFNLAIDHDGAIAAAIFHAVIDEIPEHGLQPHLTALDHELAAPLIVQPIHQGYVMVLISAASSARTGSTMSALKLRHASSLAPGPRSARDSPMKSSIR
jgi:hypothetical protein